MQKKLIIIEDDFLSKFAYEIALKEKFTLTIVDEPDQFLSNFRDREYDLAMLDINLGDKQITGSELLIKVKQEFPESKTKFVAVTAYSLEEDRKKFIQIGFDSFIPKPIDFDSLSTILNGI